MRRGGCIRNMNRIIHHGKARYPFKTQLMDCWLTGSTKPALLRAATTLHSRLPSSRSTTGVWAARHGEPHTASPPSHFAKDPRNSSANSKESALGGRIHFPIYKYQMLSPTLKKNKSSYYFVKAKQPETHSPSVLFPNKCYNAFTISSYKAQGSPQVCHKSSDSSEERGCEKVLVKGSERQPTFSKRHQDALLPGVL